MAFADVFDLYIVCMLRGISTIPASAPDNSTSQPKTCAHAPKTVYALRNVNKTSLRHVFDYHMVILQCTHNTDGFLFLQLGCIESGGVSPDR
jgi:hypothetical protein